MKKVLFTLIAVSLLMSSCGSYESTGAYTGAQFGNVLGSAIGGLTGGWRGHEIGAIAGTVAGAATGAAIGAAADRKQERKYQERISARMPKQQQQQTSQYDADDSGFDPQMRGDDRITFSDAESFNPTGALIIRRASIVEQVADNIVSRGEQCKVVFEIANTSSQPVYDVIPLVDERTGNKHIHISPSTRVESIAPHQAIRYTAMLVADNRLKDGSIRVRVRVAQSDRIVDSETRNFTLRTSKRPIR
ncbi:MAG: hypothetical protein IJ570_04380 [Prevotella sp.]|nr:hypothetical protein [Prevotella sp.]